MSQEISLEEVIKRIVVQTGHSREEILEYINEAISNVNGLLTPVGAALVLADKLKVNVDLDQLEPSQGKELTSLKIKDLMNGMKNINVLGRVYRISSIRTFQRKDGTQGRVASVFIKDSTGKIRVSLWDQKADLVNKISTGEIIGVYNGYTKKGYNDQVQIHVGNRGMIRPKPDGVKESDFPTNEVKTCQIKDLGEQLETCNVIAKILQKFPPNTFERDGVEKKVANVRIGDDTGTTRVVFWTENIGDYEALEEDTVYDFKNMTVRKNTYNGVTNFELHAGPDSKFKKSSKSVEVKAATQGTTSGELIEDFDDIPEKGFGLSIKGKVIFKSDVNHWNKNGREGDVARINLQDKNLKTVTVVFWTQTIEAFNKLNEGDIIEVQDVYSKLNRERIEVSMKDSSTIKTLGKEEVESAKKKIGDIQDNQSLISFEGRVKNIEEERVFSKRDGTEGRVINFTVGDETGTINVVAWQERVDEVKELEAGDGVLIDNVNTKYSDFKNMIEARLTRQSTIKKLEETDVPDLDELPEDDIRTTTGGMASGRPRIPLKEIEANKSGEFVGHVAQISKYVNSYLACPQCNKKVTDDGNGYSCVKCGKVEEPNERLIAKFTLDDGTETITVTTIGETADKFFKVNAEEKKRLLDPMERDEMVEELSKRLLLKNIVVVGKVNYNDYRDEYEVMANKIIEPDVEGEIKGILEKLESS